MKRRRKFREIEVIETLLHQGVSIICFRCKEPITLNDVEIGNVQKEHLHEIALDGPDEPGNCRYSHKGKPCHHFATFGNGATTAGSSVQRIAKANNPDRRVNFIVDKRPIGLTACVNPGDRCRGCGEYGDSCVCKKHERLSPLAGKRRRERARASTT